MSAPTPFWGRNNENLKARGAAQAALIILEKIDKVASCPQSHTLCGNSPSRSPNGPGLEQESSGLYGSKLIQPRDAEIASVQTAQTDLQRPA